MTKRMTRLCKESCALSTMSGEGDGTEHEGSPVRGGVSPYKHPWKFGRRTEVKVRLTGCIKEILDAVIGVLLLDENEEGLGDGAERLLDELSLPGQRAGPDPSRSVAGGEYGMFDLEEGRGESCPEHFGSLG